MVPTRFIIGVMLFTACFMNYMVRVNMSINLIAMVNPNTNSTTGGVAECVIINGNFDAQYNSTHYEKHTSLPDVRRPLEFEKSDNLFKNTF